MKIKTGYLSPSGLYSDITAGRVIVPEYQREYCWTPDKIMLFIDSLVSEIPVGVLHFRSLPGWGSKVEVVDGLHRIRTLFNILLGKGVFFNFEKRAFTLDPTDFNYSGLTVSKSGRLTSLITIRDAAGNPDYDRCMAFHAAYEKIYLTQLLHFTYEGTDVEVETAFARINEAGVALTPVFNKVEGSQILII